MCDRHLLIQSDNALFLELSFVLTFRIPLPKSVSKGRELQRLGPSPPPSFTAPFVTLNWRKSQRNVGGSVSSLLRGCGSSWQWGMPSLNSLRVIWSANYMQRLRSLKENLTLLSPGKCQQMTLSPSEQALWFLVGKLGESGNLEITRDWGGWGTLWFS